KAEGEIQTISNVTDFVTSINNRIDPDVVNKILTQNGIKVIPGKSRPSMPDKLKVLPYNPIIRETFELMKDNEYSDTEEGNIKFDKDFEKALKTAKKNYEKTKESEQQQPQASTSTQASSSDIPVVEEEGFSDDEEEEESEDEIAKRRADW